ncbi:fimbrial protein [Pseudomonas sp. 18175]|uniref:fimbrial protein n=1 Tax=Pseudomonas sp. 18175 TaxID=3390056 RepID=UPI003D1990DA
MKHSIKLVLTMLALGLPHAVYAACDRYANVENSVSFPATINVPTTLPVGALITSQAFGGPYPIIVMNCNTPVTTAVIGQLGAPVRTGIYQTSVAGIGMRVWGTFNTGLSTTLRLDNHGSILPPGANQHNYTSLRAEFYKTGPVGSGTLAAGRIIELTFNGNRVHRLVLNTAIRFVNPATTCDLAAGDVNRTITFAPIKTSDLKDVNFAGMQNFELTANCTGASKVTFRFSGTPANGNSLFFANTGTAEGVALWMGSNLNGVQQTISPNANNVREVPVSGNRAVLPMLAAYHKNGTVGAGTLVSNATVNITYN